MVLFIFGLFLGCGLGVFFISIMVKSKEADEAGDPRLPAGVEAGLDRAALSRCGRVSFEGSSSAELIQSIKDVLDGNQGLLLDIME